VDEIKPAVRLSDLPSSGEESFPNPQEPLPPPTLLPPPAEPDFLVGPDGVGWGFLLYLILAVFTGVVLSFLLHEIQWPKIWEMLVGETAGLAAAVIPGFVMAQLEHRPFGAYGLPRSAAFGRAFWEGTVWGIVSLSLLMFTLRGFGAFYFGAVVLHGLRIFKFAAFWGVMFLVVGFFEEFLVRGYTQFTLSRGLGFWPTAIILSTSFGAMHLGNKGESWIGAMSAGTIGLFFCLTLRRTGNLWFAVGLHASWDWGQTYLYSVPNSGLKAPGHLLGSSFHGPRWLTGGTVGPEASVLVFALIALMWIVFDRTHRVVEYRNC
jgi:CAAX protease family protein